MNGIEVGANEEIFKLNIQFDEQWSDIEIDTSLIYLNDIPLDFSSIALSNSEYIFSWDGSDSLTIPAVDQIELIMRDVDGNWLIDEAGQYRDGNDLIILSALHCACPSHHSTSSFPVISSVLNLIAISLFDSSGNSDNDSRTISLL